MQLSKDETQKIYNFIQEPSANIPHKKRALISKSSSILLTLVFRL